MAKVQFAGLISGLDVYALIVGLVKAESRTVDVFTGSEGWLPGRGRRAT